MRQASSHPFGVLDAEGVSGTHKQRFSRGTVRPSRSAASGTDRVVQIAQGERGGGVRPVDQHLRPLAVEALFHVLPNDSGESTRCSVRSSCPDAASGSPTCCATVINHATVRSGTVSRLTACAARKVSDEVF
jgi:hypothetical protein